MALPACKFDFCTFDTKKFKNPPLCNYYMV
jgi:hypothetical protein